MNFLFSRRIYCAEEFKAGATQLPLRQNRLPKKNHILSHYFQVLECLPRTSMSKCQPRCWFHDPGILLHTWSLVLGFVQSAQLHRIAWLATRPWPGTLATSSSRFTPVTSQITDITRRCCHVPEYHCFVFSLSGGNMWRSRGWAAAFPCRICHFHCFGAVAALVMQGPKSLFWVLLQTRPAIAQQIVEDGCTFSFPGLF